jgi:hypothetical protein
MTPVEELRAAATLIRETASKATPGGRATHPSAAGTGAVDVLANGTYIAQECTGPDAEWIALMSPDKAEPIAAWLERCAEDLADARHYVDEPVSCEHALTVARQILGRQP